MTKKIEETLINPKSLQQVQICELFSVDRSSVNDWVKKGCPTFKDTSIPGRPTAYDLGSVIRWRMEWIAKRHDVTDKSNLETKRLKEQIKKLELENADREKKTVTRERFEQIQRKQAHELMNFFTEGYKRNAQLMMKNIGIPANKLVDFLEVWDGYVKEAMDKFVSSGEDIE